MIELPTRHPQQKQRRTIQTLRRYHSYEPRSAHALSSTTTVTSPPPTSSTPTPPFLPPEVLSLIISHYIGPYTLRITHAWWDFDSTIRIRKHNVPPTDDLALVSRTFNRIVKRQLRRRFLGVVRVDWDAAGEMGGWRGDGDERGRGSGRRSGGSSLSLSGQASGKGASSGLEEGDGDGDGDVSTQSHLSWLFENIRTVQIVGYPPTRTQVPYVVDMRHWPDVRRVEVLLRISLLPGMREITTKEHDEEVLRIAGGVNGVLRIAGGVNGVLRVEGLRKKSRDVDGGRNGEKAKDRERGEEEREVEVGFVFEGCRCGQECVVRRKDRGLEIVVGGREGW